MKPSVLFRIASVLIVCFALGHTLGFRNVDPRWNAGTVVDAMQSHHFLVQGFNRSYWDFYVGFGLFVSVFMLLGAVLAWQLGGLVQQNITSARSLAWTLAACFAANAVLAWRYFFVAPLVFSLLIVGCLSAGTLLARSPEQR